MSESKVNISLTISNDKTVVSLVLSSDSEITHQVLANVLKQHVDLLNSYDDHGGV